MSLASVKSEIGGELAASSGVSTPGSVGHDIITEQPRSQHTLQADSVDLSGCDLTSAATDGDEEDILSHSSSQFSAVPSDPAMDLNDGTQASSPISDSSQTTTEGPDSAVTPSDSSEIVSGWRVLCFFCIGPFCPLELSPRCPHLNPPAHFSSILCINSAEAPSSDG